MATGKINLGEFKTIVKQVINDVETKTGERPKNVYNEMKAVTKEFFRTLIKEQFNKKQVTQHFKSVWSQDPDIRKKIMLSKRLTKKFGKYLEKK